MAMLAAQQAFLDGTLNRKYVSVVKHPDFDLWILNYTAACQYDRAWDAITVATRGLILDGQGHIVARPFPKFFNLGERPETQVQSLPDLPFTVLEKIDGSLGVLYRGPDDQLRVATRGSFTSAQAAWATNWLNGLNDETRARLGSILDSGLTPLFEIVYPGIEGPVIHYGWEGLALLALIENKTGADREWGEVRQLADGIGVRTPTVYDFGALDEVLAQQPFLPVNSEGFVIRFANGLRVKVKGDQYAELFRAVSNFSARVVLEAMQNGHEEFFVTLPEELRPQAETIRAAITGQISELRRRAAGLFAAAPKETRKDFALWVRAHVTPEMHGVLFNLLDGREPDWYRLVDLGRLDNAER
jgi:RNA ligase